MALTPAEKQRAYRTRRRERREAQLSTAADDQQHVFLQPFFEWAEDDANWSSFTLPLDLAGITAPTFEDDRGPAAFVLNDATEGVDEPFSGSDNSLGRADVMVGCLIDAAAALADVVNRYKAREIDNRLKELEDEVTNPERRKTALAEIVRLNKMKDQLTKQVRWSFPQWKVTGV